MLGASSGICYNWFTYGLEMGKKTTAHPIGKQWGYMYEIKKFHNSSKLNKQILVLVPKLIIVGEGILPMMLQGCPYCIISGETL